MVGANLRSQFDDLERHPCGAVDHNPELLGSRQGEIDDPVVFERPPIIHATVTDLPFS